MTWCSRRPVRGRIDEPVSRRPQIHYQGVLDANSLLSVRGMIRDLTSELWSDARATPVWVQQDRGFREGALMGGLAVNGERHVLKLGGDLRLSWAREQFSLAEPEELPELVLNFRDRRRGVETSAYVQDQFKVGDFAFSLGLRMDRYELLVKDMAFSPRFAASYYVSGIATQVYASYDRVFQPPPIENLLLSSAVAGFGLDEVQGDLPVPASRAHFVEVGVRKPLADMMRLDVKHFWRSFRNPIDDDVFLNTGLSFPITFDSARIEGTEALLELPRWRGISSVFSYSNMLGRTRSPVTGGLFVEDGEAAELRDLSVEFPISQDQRNTVAAMSRFQLHRRVWLSVGTRYGSGLPVELEDDDDEEGAGDDGEDAIIAEQPISQAILDSVDFDRARVKPSLSLDFSLGARVWERGSRRTATLQFDLRNVADRLNVINFSGLFSGTALAPGRQATLQLRLQF